MIVVLDHDSLVVSLDRLVLGLAGLLIDESRCEVAVGDQVGVLLVGEDARRVVRLRRHRVERRHGALKPELLHLGDDRLRAAARRVVEVQALQDVRGRLRHGDRANDELLALLDRLLRQVDVQEVVLRVDLERQLLGGGASERLDVGHKVSRGRRLVQRAEPGEQLDRLDVQVLRVQLQQRQRRVDRVQERRTSGDADALLLHVELEVQVERLRQQRTEILGRDEEQRKKRSVRGSERQLETPRTAVGERMLACACVSD